MTSLSDWRSFYSLLGSAAGALTGLQFVTMALVADMPRARGDAEASDAFATPTIVHFSVVLVLACLLSAPWHSLHVPAVLWCVLGLGGLVYIFFVGRQVRAQTSYRPVLEDWIFHLALPAFAYLALVPAAAIAFAHPFLALFGPAAAALLLLLIGIHNAWDNVTYLVHRKKDTGTE